MSLTMPKALLLLCVLAGSTVAYSQWNEDQPSVLPGQTGARRWLSSDTVSRPQSMHRALYFLEELYLLLDKSDENDKGEEEVPLPVVRSCDVRISQLIQGLQEDPEQHGLRPYQDFPGLSPKALEVFRGKRLALIGDSTLFYVTKWLQMLLLLEKNLQGESEETTAVAWKRLRGTSKSEVRNNLTQLDRLPIYDLTAGQENVLELNKEACQQAQLSGGSRCVNPEDYSRPKILTMGVDNITRVGWMGMSYFSDHTKTEEILNNVWETIDGSYHPDIIVANQGIHWLHLYGLQRNASAEAIRRWVHYEDWLQEVYDHAMSNNASVLLYKTVNFLCDEKIYDRYQDAMSLYTAQDPVTLERCHELVQAELDGHDGDNPWDTAITANEIADYCVNGTSNNLGSANLNQRMFAFTEELRQRHQNNSNNSMYIGIFNDNAVESCQYVRSDDGVHYHGAMLMRIRLLANQLSCVYPN